MWHHLLSNSSECAPINIIFHFYADNNLEYMGSAKMEEYYYQKSKVPLNSCIPIIAHY